MSDETNGLTNVFGRDMTGCDTIQLICWKAANFTLQDLGMANTHQLTDVQPHKPENLTEAETVAYFENYQYHFWVLCDWAKGWWDANRGNATGGKTNEKA